MTDEPQTESSEPIALGGPIAPEPAAPEPAAPEHFAHAPAAPEPPPPEPPPPAAPQPAAPQPAAPARQRRGVLMPLLNLLGFIVLAGAIAYLWTRPLPMAHVPALPPDESGAVTALQGDVATLKTELAALDAREKSDVAALHDAIAAIPPSKPSPGLPAASAPAPGTVASAPAGPAAAPDAALAQKVAALSERLGQIQAAEAAQAQHTQALPSADDIVNLEAKVAAVNQREATDGESLRQDLTVVQQQLAAITSQTQSLAKTATALPQLSAQADRLSQIVRAQEALRAGMPLGTIDSAPPALARFATTAPPTEAALRLSYADAARAADKAGQPQPDEGRFWHRVLVRVEDLVTVRQGDHVIVGDVTSGVLAHAQRLLDAGDLAGAVAVLDTLTGPAAAAIAPWEAQAKALLDARQALAQMAAS